MVLGQPAVEQGQDSEGKPGNKPPENTLINPVRKIKAGDDQKYPDKAEPRQKEVPPVQRFPVKKRLQEDSEGRERGIGQQSDRHRGDLDRPEKGGPTPRQDRSQQDEQGGVPPEYCPQALLCRPEENTQGQAGEENASQDDQQRGEGEPLPEKPGKAEQHGGTGNFQEDFAIFQAVFLFRR